MHDHRLALGAVYEQFQIFCEKSDLAGDNVIRLGDLALCHGDQLHQPRVAACRTDRQQLFADGLEFNAGHCSYVGDVD